MGRFTTAFLRYPSGVKARLTLNRTPVVGEASVSCGPTVVLRLVSRAISRVTATCDWSVPRRLAGRRVSGHVAVKVEDQLQHGFTRRLPPKV